MSGHTPGPWRTNKLDWRAVEDSQGLIVADVRTPPSEGGREDARLIAAAPDLLEALSWLVDLQNGCPLPKYEADWNRTMAMARAAIAKAEGR